MATCTSGLEQNFPGDTEMSRRMRALDWSATALGPPEQWPAPLKHSVKLCLTSRFPIGIFWGPELIMLYNDPYIPFLGETKHPMYLGRRTQEAWSDVWETIDPLFESVRRTGEATWSEDFLFFFARNLPLEEVYVTFTYSPIFLDSGDVGGIFCPCAETTEKVVSARRLETLRKLAVEALETQSVDEACEVTAKALAENPFDIPFAAIYLFDKDGNRAELKSVAGLPYSDHPFPSTVSVSDDDRSPWALAEVFRERQTTETPDLIAAGLRLPGGPWPEPSSKAMVLPFFSAQRDLLCGLAVLGVSPRRVLDDAYRTFFHLIAGDIGRAISDAHAYEAEQKRAETLAELDRAKTVFFSNVSHEFRTPLTLMLGPIEDMLLRANGSITVERQELDLVHRNVRRLLKLVNTLLDFSRIEANRIQAFYEPTDLSAFTIDLASIFRSAIERAGLRLTIDCPPLPELVYLDRSMWEKIVLNLISNALKFTFEGEIEVSLRASEDHAELAVRDTGTGIPESEMPRLFERFHRVEGARGRTFEGSGIGLGLVQELARLHGGAVRVESHYGRGSRFVVSIPFGRAHLPVAHTAGEPKQVTMTPSVNAFVDEALRWLPHQDARDWRVVLRDADDYSTENETAMPGERPKILFADDNADLREYVRRLLSEHYTVTTVSDGETALRAALHEPPDLLLTDVMMPGLDGFGLLKAWRREPRTRTIPVILLSARAGEESRVEGLTAGADDYLVKPFSARELLARVSARLEIAGLHREALVREQTLRFAAEHAERKVARKNDELSAANARAESVLASVRDLHIVLDRQWRYAYVNDAAVRSIGCPHSEILGRTLWELFPDIVGTELDHQYRRAMDQRKPVEFDFHYVTRDTWWANRFYPTSEGLAVFATDITARKHAEAALKQARDEMEQRVHERTSQLSVVNTELINEIAERERAEIELTLVKDELAADLKTMIRLHELSTRLMATSELEALLQEILDAAIELLHSDFGNVQLYDPELDALKIVVHRGFKQDFLDHFNKVSEESPACRRALRHAERVIIEDVETDPDFAPHRQIAAAAGFRAVQSTPLFNRSGEPLGVISTHFRQRRRPLEHELTFLDLYAHLAAEFIDRHRSAAALNSSENRFRRYFELGLIGMTTTSPTRGFLEVNDELCRILGYEREELLKKSWPEITPPDDLAADMAQFNRVLADEIDGYAFDKRWIRKDGQIIDTIMSVNCVCAADGSVEYFVSLVQDIGDRKKAEERLREYEKAVEGLEEMIVVIGRDYRYRLANRAFLTYTGRQREQIIGRLVAEFVSPDVWEQVIKERIDEALQGKIVEYEMTYEFASAGKRDLFVSYFPIEGPDGVDRIACVFHDITERKLGEDALRKAQAELAHVCRVTTLGELTSSIAHEVNQPLGAIVTNGHACLRLLSRPEPSVELAREAVDAMIADAMRASEVIKRIRAMLKKTPTGRSLHQINETVRDVIAFTTAEREKNRISLATELTPELPLVVADRVQLQQVVLNLVLNSIEAMSRPHWEPRNLLITTRKLAGNDVLVTVGDSGVGVGARQREQIFEPFFTTKEGGLGLGLSISRTIITAHGGRLWTVPNADGPGSTFCFTLPITRN